MFSGNENTMKKNKAGKGNLGIRNSAAFGGHSGGLSENVVCQHRQDTESGGAEAPGGKHFASWDNCRKTRLLVLNERGKKW